MWDRGSEDVFIDNENFSKPLHYPMKTSKGPHFSNNFSWPLSVSNLMSYSYAKIMFADDK